MMNGTLLIIYLAFILIWNFKTEIIITGTITIELIFILEISFYFKETKKRN